MISFITVLKTGIFFYTAGSVILPVYNIINSGLVVVEYFRYFTGSNKETEVEPEMALGERGEE